jgi:ABC-2 type transport system permease protein
MKTFLMLIRREYWEHRMLWLTPLVIAGLIIVGTAFLGQRVVLETGGPPPGADLSAMTTHSQALFGLLQLGIGLPFYIVAALIAIAYLLDCLYAERRDRSILFWKSLPVSDSAVVLSKFCVALVLIPLGFFCASALTSLVVDAIWALRGPNAANAPLVSMTVLAAQSWSAVGWLRTQGIVLYTMFATVLWYAPYGAYLLLVSAWGKRSVLAWAIAPPVLLAALEKLLLGTTVLGRMVQRGYSEMLNLAFRVNRQLEITVGDVIRAPRGGGGGGGGRGRGGLGGPGSGFDPRFDPTDLLSSPQLWIGLVAAALMVWAAIGLRRRSQEI